MRFSTILGPVLVALGTLNVVSAGAAGDKFAALSYRNGGALELTPGTFSELADAPRDAGAAVLFTTMAGGAQCEACKQVQPQWNSLSKQWSKRRDASLVFGTLDFFKAREVFTRVRALHPLSGQAKLTFALQAARDTCSHAFVFPLWIRSSDQV